MFRRTERERLERIEHRLNAATNLGEEKWAVFLRKQEEYFDKLLQSHAALEQQQQKEFSSLAGYIGSNQASLDMVLQRLGAIEQRLALAFALFGSRDGRSFNRKNGKRKR